MNKESSELNDTVSDLARGGRSWATLDQITSLDGESDEATLKQMKNDASFLSFCKENNVEIQEEVEGDVAAEMGGPAKKEEEEEEEEQKQEEEVAPTLELVKEDIEIIQQEEAIVFEESEEESESESESEEEEEQEEVVVVEEKKEEVVVEEEKPEDDYDDISVSSEEEEVEEERRPPADFTEWLSKDTWNAWRGMCAGRSPPPEVFGKKRAKSKWDKLSPILGGGGGKRRKKPMTGFGVRRSAHAASNLPPLTPNPALDRYAINTHGLGGPLLKESASAATIPKPGPSKAPLRPQTAPQLLAR